jgi:CRP-like cAMP-binding protein
MSDKKGARDVAAPAAHPPQPLFNLLADAGNEVSYAAGTTIFAQGDPAHSVLYVKSGRATLSVQSVEGKEAVVAIIRQDDILGEGCLIGQSKRSTTAATLTTHQFHPEAQSGGIC